MRARRHVRHVQLCLFCGVSGDVDLCPRDADGDTANDGVCGYVEAYPADNETMPMATASAVVATAPPLSTRTRTTG